MDDSSISHCDLFLLSFLSVPPTAILETSGRRTIPRNDKLPTNGLMGMWEYRVTDSESSWLGSKYTISTAAIIPHSSISCNYSQSPYKKESLRPSEHRNFIFPETFSLIGPISYCLTACSEGKSQPSRNFEIPFSVPLNFLYSKYCPNAGEE